MGIVMDKKRTLQVEGYFEEKGVWAETDGQKYGIFDFTMVENLQEGSYTETVPPHTMPVYVPIDIFFNIISIGRFVFNLLHVLKVQEIDGLWIVRGQKILTDKNGRVQFVNKGGVDERN